MFRNRGLGQTNGRTTLLGTSQCHSPNCLTANFKYALCRIGTLLHMEISAAHNFTPIE